MSYRQDLYLNDRDYSLKGKCESQLGVVRPLHGLQWLRDEMFSYVESERKKRKVFFPG